MKYMITATGHLTTEAPVAVSPPDHFNDAKRIHMLPRETIYRDGVPVKAAIIPAATFRGALRHAITGYAFEEMNAAAERNLFQVADYIWTAQGGVTDKKAEGTEEFVEIELPERVRRENPIMGIWGNFTHKMASLVEMRAARVIDTDAIILVPAQVRTDPLERDYRLLGLFDKTDLDAFKDELAARRRMVRAENEGERIQKRLGEVKDGKREMGAEDVKAAKDQLTKLEAEIKVLAEKAGGAVNLQQITTRYEAIAEGAVLDHGWTLRDVSIDEAAVFLLAFRVWVSNGARVGAIQRSGCGKLKGYYDLAVKPMQTETRLAPPQAAGRLSFAYETGVVVEGANEVMQEVIEAEKRLISGGIAAWNMKAA